MPTTVSTILRAVTRTEKDPLNILTYCTHERYESCFALLPHQFYAYRGPGIKDWNKVFASLPLNYTLLEPNQIPPDLDFDVILSQNKFGQFPVAKRFSETWQVPLISLEHTLPHPGWSELHITRIRNQRGHVNVFLSEYSKNAWGWEDEAVIIPPGIDTDTFMPEWVLQLQPAILSVVNDWINRDWACGFSLWKEVTKGLPVMVLGDTPGLSKPAKNTQELVSAYRQCQVFLNTSLVSTAPFTLLEAMACGCAVVSTATTMIPQIVEDGVNGFCSNDPAVLRQRCEQLLADVNLCRKLGREARKTMEERFSFKRMAADWDAVLRTAANIIVTSET